MKKFVLRQFNDEIANEEGKIVVPIPDDTNIVHKSGEEEVFDQKTFYGDIFFNNGAGGTTLVNGNTVTVNTGTSSANLNGIRLSMSDSSNNHTEIKSDKISMYNDSDGFKFNLEKSLDLTSDITITSPSTSGQLALKTDLSIQSALDNGKTWVSDPTFITPFDEMSLFIINDDALLGNKSTIYITSTDVADGSASNLTIGGNAFAINSDKSSTSKIRVRGQVNIGQIIDVNLISPSMTTGTYYVATKDDLNPQINVTSASTFAIVPTKKVIMITFTGTITTATLPPISGNDGLIIFLTNAGSGISVLNSNTGGNDIWEGGTDLTTINIPNGSIMRIINDSLKYRVL